MSDPRKATTLDEAALNSDGTYNGHRALAWLSEVLYPGRGLSVEEVEQIGEDVRRNRAHSTHVL